MFKNSLLLKIILVFTLPAVGILFFSTKLVIEKLDYTQGINRTLDNVVYLEYTQNLIHELQKERGYSVVYLESHKFSDKLIKQKEITNKKFNEYLRYATAFIKKSNENSNIEILVKDIQNQFYLLENIRLSINEIKIDSYRVLDFYSKLNEKLLNSIISIKSVKSAFAFNKEFTNISYFLLFKEFTGIERAIISKLIIDKKLDEIIQNKVDEVHTIKKSNLNYFKINSSLRLQEIYNKNLPFKIQEDVHKYRDDVLKNILTKEFDVVHWWNLSTTKVDALNKIFDEMLKELDSIAKKATKDAFLEQNVSVFYLFVSFITLISLLFLLRNIILNEQKSFEKIEKQKKVYELLNETNKQLLKKSSKEEIYTELHEMVSKNSSMVFCFVYDLEEHDKEKRIYAKDGELKDIVKKRLDGDFEKLDNLLTRAIKWKSNVLVEDFTKANISVFSEYGKKFNINSAASFPIKKFGEQVSVLVIYSNVYNFFDYEVEMLFDQMIFDITHYLEKYDYEKIRIKQEEQLKIASVAFESSEPMVITNENSEIIEANQAFCDVLGYTKDEILGKNPNLFRSFHQNESFYERMWRVLDREDSWSGEIYNKKRDGTILPVRLTVTAIRNNKNEIINYLGQYIDISDIKDREQVLEYQATHDNLTGLPNRLLLLDRIEHAITKVVRHNNVGGLIFIDLDNFKTINDTMGHDVGDVLLIEVAKKLKYVIRNEDTVSRIGGDEFIILADSIGRDKEEAKKNIGILAKKIKDALNGIEYISGHKNISTPSIGVTLFSDASVSVKDIIKQADTAMYAAKKQGKNAIEFFN